MLCVNDLDVLLMLSSKVREGPGSPPDARPAAPHAGHKDRSSLNAACDRQVEKIVVPRAKLERVAALRQQYSHWQSVNSQPASHEWPPC